jgi:hypothetical protein
MLDEAPLASLGESELAALRAHAEGCAECRGALDAAGAASLMLRARAAESFEPSPFFQTRVLAALRERRAAEEEGWTLARLWKSAGLLVSSMAATTAALVVLTFAAPQEQAVAQEVAASPYTAEALLFEEAEAEGGQMSYEQVLSTLYESESEESR